MTANPNWKEIYWRLRDLKFSERNLRADQLLVEAAPGTKPFISTVQKMEARYMRVDTMLQAQLVTLAARYFPISSPGIRATAFSNEACKLYNYLGILDTGRVNKYMYALAPNRSDTSRCFWANVMAHLLFAASIPDSIMSRADGYWHMTFLGAKYSGPVYEQFVYMLLTLYLVGGMDPAALPSMMVEKYFDQFYGPRCRGQIDPNLYFNPLNP